MTEVLWADYSYARPDISAYPGVMRYLDDQNPATSRPDLTVAEVDSIHKLGKDLGLIWQMNGEKSRAGTGYDVGRADAVTANLSADALGAPGDVVIFYTVDADLAPAAVAPYFEGVRSLTGKRPVGIYGSARIVDWGASVGIEHRWQTKAWSSGVISPNANLYQRDFLGDLDASVLYRPFPAWGPTPPPTQEAGLSTYPKADVTTQWWDDDWGWAVIKPNCAVIHTTEGLTWPTYPSADGKPGAKAPHVTARPNIAAKTLSFRQHFADEHSSRALVNLSGGVETNTANALQVELIGTCDDRYAKTWGTKVAGVDYIYWPAAPDWALQAVADLFAYWNRKHGVPLTSGLTFKAYPYGEGVRMSFDQWRAFTGFCGHQHVPENTHGDPGAFPIERVLTMARALVSGTPTPPPTQEDFIVATKAEVAALLDGYVPKIAAAVADQLTNDHDFIEAIWTKFLLVKDSAAPDPDTAPRVTPSTLLERAALPHSFPVEISEAIVHEVGTRLDGLTLTLHDPATGA